MEPQPWSTDQHHHRSHRGIYLALCIFFSLCSVLRTRPFLVLAESQRRQICKCTWISSFVPAFVWPFSSVLHCSVLGPRQPEQGRYLFFWYMFVGISLPLVGNPLTLQPFVGDHHPSKMIAERCVSCDLNFRFRHSISLIALRTHWPSQQVKLYSALESRVLFFAMVFQDTISFSCGCCLKNRKL